MDIFLTGGTGYVGTSVLEHLVAAGHHVTALVRNDDKAAVVRVAGAAPLVGDITDAALLAQAASEADAVIHVASPGDGTSAAVDTVVVETFLTALKGSDKRYLHTSGVWIHGTGDDITEDRPLDAPPLTAWRLPLDAQVLAAAGDGVHSVVIAPAVVYGRGSGIPAMVKYGPTTGDDEPALLFPGSGDQHWTTIHVDDLGALYLAALEHAPAGSYYLAVNGDNPTVREIAAAASTAAGLGGRVAAEPAADTTARLGAFGDALLLDQQATGAKARRDLGWAPKEPGLLADLTEGSYAG